MSRQMKILHVVTALSWRGGEQQVAYLMDELKDKVKSIVLCSEGSLMEAHCKKNKITHVCQKRRGGVDLAYAKKLKKTCIDFKIDACHLHDAHAHTHAIIAASVLKNKLPLVLSRRVDFPIKKSWFSSFKYNHKSIAKILCVSKTIQKITAQGIKDQSKLTTVYSGIDLTKFKTRTNKLRNELKISQDSFLIGNTSALADHKDYFTFLDTAEKVLQEAAEVHFVIMGDGPMREEIKAYAATKRLDNRLYFTGFRTDIPEVLADLDLFLITSKTEGLGTSILDAFACKVPVLATKAGGIPELVIDQKTGLLREVKDVESLSKAALLLQKDKELSTRLITNASEKLIEFSKQNTAQQTLKVYQSLLS